MDRDEVLDLSALGREHSPSPREGALAMDALGRGAGIQLVELFNPERNPCRGMVSALTPSGLGSGEWSLIQNVRLDDGSLRVRDGAGTPAEYPSSGIPSGSELRGGILEASSDLVALKHGGVTKVFQLASGTWQEVTDSTTRFPSGSADQKVEFALVREAVFPEFAPFGGGKGEWVIWQNGKDRPRIKNRAFTGTGSAAVVEPVPGPRSSTVQARPTVMAFARIASLGTGDFSTSDSAKVAAARWTLSNVGNYAHFEFKTTVTSGAYARLNLVGSGVLNFGGANPRQIQMVYSTTDETVWERVEVRLRKSDGSWHVVYSPSQKLRPVLGSSGLNYRAAGFSVGTVFLTDGTPTSLDSGASYDQIEFRYVDASAPAVAIALDIFAFTLAPDVPVESEFGVTVFNDSSRVESPGVIAETALTPMLKEVGGTPIPYARLAAEPGFRYRFLVSAQKPGGLPSGTVYQVVYLRQGGQMSMTARSQTNLSASAALAIVTDSIDEAYVVDRTMPDALHLPIPTGCCMTYAGGRLFVGNAREHSDTVVDGEVWFSESHYPTRFRRAYRLDEGGFDPRSAGKVVLNHEPVKALAHVSSSVLGAESVLAWTSKACFSMDGADSIQLSNARIVAPHGTLSPWSVSAYQNTVLWVDQDLQLQVLGGTVQALGAQKIEDWLKRIPANQVKEVTSCAFRDRVFFGLTPTGASGNIAALVLDQRSGVWTVDVLGGGFSFGRFAPADIGGVRRLLCFGTDAKVFEHEKAGATSDGTVEPSLKLSSRELTNGFWSRFSVRKIGVVMDRLSSAHTLTTRRVGRGFGVSVSGQLDGSSGTLPLAWRWDRGSDGAPCALSDLGIRVEIEAQLPGGTRIYSIVAEVDLQKGEGADSL